MATTKQRNWLIRFYDAKDVQINTLEVDYCSESDAATAAEMFDEQQRVKADRWAIFPN